MSPEDRDAVVQAISDKAEDTARGESLGPEFWYGISTAQFVVAALPVSAVVEP